jgi:hypothetical protein
MFLIGQLPVGQISVLLITRFLIRLSPQALDTDQL